MTDVGSGMLEAAEGPVPDRLRELVDVVGGPVAAARIARAARSTLDLWLGGKSRVPFGAMSRLAQAGDRSLDWLAGTAGQEQQRPPGLPVPGNFVAVPQLGIQPDVRSSGVSKENHQVLAMREDWLRRIGLTPGLVEALIAVGDSLEPTIRDGDILLVDRSIDHVVDNGIYVVVFGGAVLVKRIQLRRDKSLVLMSDNRVYPDEVVPESEVSDLVIEGRVRWFGRTI